MTTFLPVPLDLIMPFINKAEPPEE